MSPPWWFCNGWWSPWCVADMVLHKITRTDSDELPGWLRWICLRHDASI